MKFGWYLRRLRGMSAAEILARAQVAGWQRYWAKPGRRPDPARSLKPGPRRAVAVLPRPAGAGDLPGGAAAIAAADQLMAGSWRVFHLHDTSVADVPDWFADPLTGRRAPADRYAFNVPYRSEADVGNIKFVWELSRHQATTVLAAAWWLTGKDEYARRVADHLRSWWQENPFLSGVHWVSAIEVGLRLLSWSWIRALLSDWEGAAGLFEDNPVFAAQLYQHQLYVHRFHSHGSSANNHLIAELAGMAASTAAFPWFTESARWAAWSRADLVAQAAAQTHADGLNREQASEYHLFVLEMLLAAVLPARMAGAPLPAALDGQLMHMADGLAASLDGAGRPPRFGDGDEGRGVLVDAPETDHVQVLLDACRALYGAAAWWPGAGGSVFGQVAATLVTAPPGLRDIPRPDHFSDSGMTILRAGSGAREVWVRCDAGPHGFLSIAAHGHADALSVELRCGGVDVLADPGTYCYHGEPEWRGYFKGTAGHNTLMLGGVDQAVNGGPFLWLTHPQSVLDEPVSAQSWQARHDGYGRLKDPAVHHRRVVLDEGTGVTVSDWIEAGGAHEATLSWHLGPEVTATLDGTAASLHWPGGSGRLALPGELVWSMHRGEQDPPLGWYSAGFGHKTPATTLTGHGRLSAGTTLLTRFFST